LEEAKGRRFAEVLTAAVDAMDPTPEQRKAALSAAAAQMRRLGAG
jgi:hypothetical protein